MIQLDPTKEKGSFKFGYSRGLPSRLAPKLFTNKKTEEFFVTSVLAQSLLEIQVPVIGIEVCEDDSNKGVDTLIKELNRESISLQITRFTLTDYIARKKEVERKVDSIIKHLPHLALSPIRINVTVHSLKKESLPLSTHKNQKALARIIDTAINQYKEQLLISDNPFFYGMTDVRFTDYCPVIALQKIPIGFYSNFYGRGNIFIDLDYDNVMFGPADIEKECLNIFNKKNGGKASTLLIWADTFDILYDAKPIIEKLEKQFENSSFEEVIFFSFYDSVDQYLENKIIVAHIKKARK